MAMESGQGNFGEMAWWMREGDELGGAVWAIATALESDQEFRRRQAGETLGLYEGKRRTSVHVGSQSRPSEGEEYDINVSRAACDTVISEIAGRQKPVPKFQTSGADWKTKRRAKYLEKFCLAVLHQNQGAFLNAWVLMQSSFLDTAVWGEGIPKVFNSNGKITIERAFPWELFVDPVEARYGNPQSLFSVFTMEREAALWKFARDPALKHGKKRRAEIESAIMASENLETEFYGASPRVGKIIKVVEAWRLRLPDGSPGKHAFAINNITLSVEDWDRPIFPFVRMLWEQDRLGYHAKGLVEQGQSMHREINANAEKLQERFKFCGGKRTYIQAGSVDMADMQANDAEVLVEVQKGFDIPTEQAPKPIAESELAWLRFTLENYFSNLGVSEMRASARKEPGVTAGVAIRTLNDMQTARFSLKAQEYENGFVQLAEQIIYCAREAAKADPNFSVMYEEEIKWKDCDVPENTFDITIAPASSLPNDPAGRLQMAQELYSSGIVGVETFKQLLGWPDLEKEMNHQTAQDRYVEKTLDTMLDAEDDDGFVAPDPLLLDKPRAILLAAQTYFDALYDDAPEHNLQLIRDYIAGIDEMIQAAMAPPPMPPGAGPEAGGVPGAEPDGPVPFAPEGAAPPSPGGELAARPPIA